MTKVNKRSCVPERNIFIVRSEMAAAARFRPKKMIQRVKVKCAATFARTRCVISSRSDDSERATVVLRSPLIDARVRLPRLCRVTRASLAMSARNKLVARAPPADPAPNSVPICVFAAVENFMELSCSAAVPFGGSNKAYALDCLFKTNGDILVSRVDRSTTFFSQRCCFEPPVFEARTTNKPTL